MGAAVVRFTVRPIVHFTVPHRPFHRAPHRAWQDTLWSPEAGGPFSIARAAVQYLAHLDPMGLGRGAAAVAER